MTSTRGENAPSGVLLFSMVLGSALFGEYIFFLFVCKQERKEEKKKKNFTLPSLRKKIHVNHDAVFLFLIKKRVFNYFSLL